MSQETDRTNDPVCGMIVDKATSLHVEREGEQFYFCSDHCRQKFLAAPADAQPAEKAGCCG